MTALRMDNIEIIVEDLEATIAFFEELGLTLEGRATVEGESVDRLIGLEGVRSEIAMMKTPDGQGRLELCRFLSPAAQAGPRNAPVNTRGIGRIMFNVPDIDAVVARLQARGAELLGEIVQYENSYRLCYLRGPEGILLALAQPLG